MYTGVMTTYGPIAARQRRSMPLGDMDVSRTVATYVVVGVAVTPLYFLSNGVTSAAAYILISALAVIGLIVGPMMHRVPRPAP